jgi:GT2 family glycosyltransferase/glycosyltransferase involved in cell wall biosynthesis
MKRVKSILEQGNFAYRSGLYEDAISFYNQAISINPRLKSVLQENIKMANYRLSISEKNEGSGLNHEVKKEVIIEPKEYKGRIEQSDSSLFRGWVINENKFDEIFELKIYLDGVLFDVVRNNEPRHDLLRKGISAGKGGFLFNIPNELLDSSEPCIRLEYPGGGVFFEKKIKRCVRTTVPKVQLYKERKNISIIIPIYNAVDDVKVCIERLVKYTSSKFDIILINDCSSDLSVGDVLSKAASQFKNVRIFCNDINLGFTKTVNKGIELACENDVILLNSDARVTPRWIEGLITAAESDGRIATVTPMSDRAGAFSAPKIGNENELPIGISEDEYAVAFRRRSIGSYPTVPTGNGFCMFIRRECINEIGLLDDISFPRGYGEENDFCMRARKAGWRNIIDDRTYIFHDRSKSFGDEKNDLIKNGREVIDIKYPDYKKAIQVFSSSEKIKSARYLASKAVSDCFKKIKPRILYVISTQTGGTPQTNRDLMFSLIGTVEPWLFRSDSKELFLYKINENFQEILIEKYQLSEFVDPITHTSFEYDSIVSAWLSRYDFEIVHVRHIGWHSINLMNIAKKSGSYVIFSFHDYYALCPTVKLIDENSLYCGGRCTSTDGECNAEIWPATTLPRLKNAWVREWRNKFEEALLYCDAYITTSESAKETILRNFNLNDYKPFEVIAHGRDFSIFRKPDFSNFPQKIIKILVPGNLDKAKGLNVINNLLDLDVDKKLEFHILGQCNSFSSDPRVKFYGVYKRDEFISKVELINPHIGVVFSIWDETWCHTLTELWASGVPTIVFDFPTVANRTRETGCGWVFTNKEVDDLYGNLVRICLDNNEYSKKLENIKIWQDGLGLSNSVKFMAMQYLNVYKKKSGLKVKEIVCLVCPSNEHQSQAPGSTYVRVWEKTKNHINRDVTYLRLNKQQFLGGVRAGLFNKAIIQRTAIDADAWNELKNHVIENRLEYIYDVDDNLIDVPLNIDVNLTYHGYRSTLIDILRFAKMVTVSTDALKTLYLNYNSKTVVEENRLSRDCWVYDVKKINHEDNMTALYFGSNTHGADFEIIIPALDKINKKYPSFKVKLIGVDDNSYENIPWIERVEIPVDGKIYPRFVDFIRECSADCFLGLAPLKEIDFNLYKSPLKIMEYFSLGLPVIASNYGPYHKFMNDKSYVTVGNDVDSWFLGIDALIQKRLLYIKNRELIYNKSTKFFFDYRSFDAKYFSGK